MSKQPMLENNDKPKIKAHEIKKALTLINTFGRECERLCKEYDRN